MNQTGPVSENELHAYADGLLERDRIAEVEAWLAAHPQMAAEVAEWKAQNQALRAAFAEPGHATARDAAMIGSLRESAPLWRNMAASLALLALGGAGGYMLHDVTAQPPALARAAMTLPAEAGNAYLIYASEVRHPVEVPAAEEEHLVTWLGKRLDHPFATPDLRTEGYHLIGGRLLPVNGQAGAMLMYENAEGNRLSVIIARNNGATDTAFQFSRAGEIGTFYWIDGPMGYAITGKIDEAALRRVTTAVYEQL